MLSVAKIMIALFALSLSLQSQGRNINILAIGQSIASNCNEHAYENSPGIYQFDINGNQKPASDPFDWADCSRGSMWIPLGQRLISTGFARKVTFMPIGISGTTVQDWLHHGKAFGKLSSAIKIATDRGVKFDYALWHQGSSDIGKNTNKYGIQLSQVLKFTSLNIKIDKWVIAQHSRCGDKLDEEIAKKQLEVASAYILRRFPGPDTNKLGPEFRFDGCHLNKKGQEKMADLWYESIISAEKTNQAIQEESLLKYFRLY